MKTLGLKIAAIAVIGSTAIAASAQNASTTQNYILKDVVVTSYEFKQDKLFVRTNNGRMIEIRTPSTRFFDLCDGSVRRLTNKQAAQLIQPGDHLRLDVVWTKNTAIAKRGVLIS